MILTITGPSGVGKTTLMHNLLQSLPNAKTVESVTTRAPRPTDEPGEYRYVSEEEFAASAKRCEFLWEAHPHGKSYATTKKAIDDALASDTVFISPLVVGAVGILTEYAKVQGKEGAVRSFYIWTDDIEELRRRFHTRADMTEAEIEQRLEECRSWNVEAKGSGLSFIYLQATHTPEEILAHALTLLTDLPK
jgi:guanylate kinase